MEKRLPMLRKITYIYDLAAKSTTQITTDGRKNAIINGITDWFMRRICFVRAFDWSKDSKS
jgi:dipeptidyl-peptidase-4